MSQNQLNDNLIAHSNQDQNEPIRVASSQDTDIALVTHQENLPIGQKIMQALDIFSFLPVPRTSPISTRRSICGSFLLLFIFFGYIVYSFVTFCVSNYPRMNQYSEPLGNQRVKVPQTAFGFVFGINLDETFYNAQYFTFKFQMVTKVAGEPDDKPQFSLSSKNCGDLDWIGPPYSDKSKFQLVCPDGEHVDDYVMQGLLYASPKQVYPRITVTYCNDLTSLLFCRNKNDLLLKTSGGRLYLFSEQPDSVNYATGKTTTGDTNFNLNYYFLVPGDYNRAELVMQQTKTSIFPDYLTSFSEKINESLNIASQNFYVSDVSFYDPYSAFQLWMRLDDNVQNIDVVYDTITTKVSEWGAFWGVLFAAFAFYFLKYNTNKFYAKNKDWANFDKELEKVENLQASTQQYYQGPPGQQQQQYPQQQQQYINPNQQYIAQQQQYPPQEQQQQVLTDSKLQEQISSQEQEEESVKQRLNDQYQP